MNNVIRHKNAVCVREMGRATSRTAATKLIRAARREYGRIPAVWDGVGDTLPWSPDAGLFVYVLFVGVVGKCGRQDMYAVDVWRRDETDEE